MKRKTHISPRHDLGNTPYCPGCDRRYAMVKMTQRRWRCRHCLWTGIVKAGEYMVDPKPKTVRTNSGSGQIAGPVYHRGLTWGKRGLSGL